jgi:hypothetical protein
VALAGSIICSHSVGETDQAVTWTSTDGVHWRQTHAGVFGRTGLYAYSHLSAATATAWHGWVVVGDRSDNGSSNQSALAARSARGTAWILARDSTHRILVGGHRVARHDLRGDVDGTRAMNDLAVVGGEMVASVGRRPPEALAATTPRSGDPLTQLAGRCPSCRPPVRVRPASTPSSHPGTRW